MTREHTSEGDCEAELKRATHAIVMALECVPRNCRKTRARLALIERHLRRTRAYQQRFGFE